MSKQKIIAVVGQTASGKSSLALDLAKEFNGELIAADSRTIYKGMDIGTAKLLDSSSLFSAPPLTKGRLGGVLNSKTTPNPSLVRRGTGSRSEFDGMAIKQWGIDLVDPNEDFNAFDFKEYAEQKIEEIVDRGKLPIIVGGTGLYIQALIDNFNFEQEKGEAKFDALQIGIKWPREELYARIDARVDEMIKDGLVEEVRALKAKYGCDTKSMTGIGYRQVCEYLDGKIDQDEMIRLIKRDTRHYAKRQITWFKRDSRIHWVESSNEGKELVEDFL